MSKIDTMEVPSHEVLSRLAHSDPEAFEAMRRQLVEDLIDHAPEEKKARLRGLQFQVDCARRLSRNAPGSTVKIYEMMRTSFSRLNREMNHFHSPGRVSNSDARESEAKIVSLESWRHYCSH